VRIAYVVDVHDDFDSVERTVRQLAPLDLLIVGGDITTGGTPEQAADAVERWRPLAPRLLALAGNMDSAAIEARLHQLGVALDSRGVVVGDVGIFGVSAAPRSPLHTPYELDEAELARRIEAAYADIRDSRIRIFCPHAPPQGTACDRLRSGEHVGSTAVRAFIEHAQPDLVLCGHIHEARGTDTIGRTRIVNPGPAAASHYALVEVKDDVHVRLDDRGG